MCVAVSYMRGWSLKRARLKAQRAELSAQLRDNQAPAPETLRSFLADSEDLYRATDMWAKVKELAEGASWAPTFDLFSVTTSAFVTLARAALGLPSTAAPEEMAETTA